MSATRVPTLLAIVLVLMGTAACDNMTWGGVQIALKASTETPSSRAGDENLADSADIVPRPPPGPSGSTLYLVQRDRERGIGAGSILPIALISGDSLLPIAGESSRSGAAIDGFTPEDLGEIERLTLFAEGVRVGSFRIAGAARADSTYCRVRSRADGIIEIVPEASDVDYFLAIREDRTRSFPYAARAPGETTYDQRIASLNVASAIIPRVGAGWPPSVLEARADLRILPLAGSSGEAIAATFLHRDELKVGRAPAQSWSLFFLAEMERGQYRPGYVWFRQGSAGKAAPHLRSHLDWGQNGREIVLLEVFGAERRWFAAAGRRDGEWQTLFQDSCGAAASGGQAGPFG